MRQAQSLPEETFLGTAAAADRTWPADLQAAAAEAAAAEAVAAEAVAAEVAAEVAAAAGQSY